MKSKIVNPFKPGTLVKFKQAFPGSQMPNKKGDLALVIGVERHAYGPGHRYKLLFNGKVFGCDSVFLELVQST